jgi:hypothetical protein
MAKQLGGVAGGRAGKADRRPKAPDDARRRRARRNRRAGMARARAGKAVRDDDRFQVYDKAVDAVLRAEGIYRVHDGDVEYIASQVVAWMHDHAVGYVPARRTIRRHLIRMGVYVPAGRG